MKQSNTDHKETDALLAALVAASITGISALPYYEILAKDGSVIERLQEVIAVLFLPGLFVSMVVSGNVHDGSREVGAILNVLLYGLICYSILRLRRRIRSKRGANV